MRRAGCSEMRRTTSCYNSTKINTHANYINVGSTDTIIAQMVLSKMKPFIDEILSLILNTFLEANSL